MRDVIKNLFGILVIVSVNVINDVTQDNIQTVKTVNVEKRLIDKLVEECSDNIDGNEMICYGTFIDYGNVYNSCTVYIILFAIAFLIIAGIGSVYVYLHQYLKRIIPVLNLIPILKQ